MGTTIKAVCVFCGSAPGRDGRYRDVAWELGQTIARRGLHLVYGGGNVGLMGVVADAAMTAGGTVTGVIPEALVAKELAHHGLTELVVVDSMHERKALMANRADAFIALPGGFGTFEEFCEVLTWSQLGLIDKPCGLLSVGGYYDPLIALFDHAVREGFLHPAHRRLVLEAETPQAMLDRLAAYRGIQQPKWIDDDET